MGNSATVLVADPQVDILSTVQAMLVSRSYSVTTAVTGQEALETLARQSGIDLVLSEVSLPDMPGPELLRRVRQEYPSTAGMLMTGFTESALDPRTPFIAKPFTAGRLAIRVEAVLEKSAQARQTFRQARAEWQRTTAASRALWAEVRQATRQASLSTLESRQQRAARTAGLREITVLYVDDDPAWRYLISKHLSQAGMGVLVAANGEEALVFCMRYHIDMLITDVDLPEMRGTVLADRVAKHFPRMPILFLAADDVERSHPAMPKDCRPEDLVYAILRRCGKADETAGNPS